MLDIKTVYECNQCLGCKTLHPQVSLINLENPNLEQEAVKFEFYAILLIEDCPDGCYCCGRKYYDYSNYNPQNEMFRLLGTKRSFSQNETFFFSHPYPLYPALFRLISHF